MYSGCHNLSVKGVSGGRLPEHKNDLYAAFIERTLALLRATGGYMGAITSHTFIFLKSFQKLRENAIFPQARTSPMADLGFGVLDTTMVETVAFVLKMGSAYPRNAPGLRESS